MSPGVGPVSALKTSPRLWDHQHKVQLVGSHCEMPKRLTLGPNRLEMLATELAGGSSCTLGVCTMMLDWEQWLLTSWWCCHSEGPRECSLKAWEQGWYSRQ